MGGKEFVVLGVVLIILALAAFALSQLAMRKWKKRYDAQWEHKE